MNPYSLYSYLVLHLIYHSLVDRCLPQYEYGDARVDVYYCQLYILPLSLHVLEILSHLLEWH